MSLAFCLSWGMGASAATIIAGPGTPETLIQDARLTLSSSRAVGRSVPPAPVRQNLLEKVAVAAARTTCIVAGTSAANAVGSSVGYIWAVTHCMVPSPPEPLAEPLRLANLYLPPPPAPFWPAQGAPVRLLAPGGGGGGPRLLPAPVPLPAAGLALPAALGLLAALGRRRRRRRCGR